MGTTQNASSNIGITKGFGYRVITIQPNSPAAPLLEQYFDFIVDAIPQKQPDRSPKDILSKLTNEAAETRSKPSQSLASVLASCEDQPITLRVVSTKYRKVRNVEIVPSRTWNEEGELLGAELRLQRYDEVFDTYYPFTNIKPHSPIRKSGILEGEYLIGARQFKYDSIDGLLQNLYDRYFDKMVEDKHIHFAVYSIPNDELRVVPVLLERGWGDKGLLGCEFLEGHLYKFPKNLEEIREAAKFRKAKSETSSQLKKQLNDINGASLSLVESLRAQKGMRKKRNLRTIKSLLQIHPQRQQAQQPEPNQEQEQNGHHEGNGKLGEEGVSRGAYERLQRRVRDLEDMLSQVRAVIENLEDESEGEQGQ